MNSMHQNGTYGMNANSNNNNNMAINIKQEDYFDSITLDQQSIDQQAIDDLISNFDSSNGQDIVLQDSKDFMAMLEDFPGLGGANGSMMNGCLNVGPCDAFDMDNQFDDFGDAQFASSVIQDIISTTNNACATITRSTTFTVNQHQYQQQHMSYRIETNNCSQQQLHQSNGPSLLNMQLQQSARPTPNMPPSPLTQYNGEPGTGISYNNNEHGSTPPINSPQQQMYHQQQQQQRSMMPKGGGPQQPQQLGRQLQQSQQVPVSNSPFGGNGGCHQMNMQMKQPGGGAGMINQQHPSNAANQQYSAGGGPGLPNRGPVNNAGLLLQTTAPPMTPTGGQSHSQAISHNSPQESPHQIMSPSMSAMLMRTNSTPSPHQTLTSPHTMAQPGSAGPPPGTSPSPAGCVIGNANGAPGGGNVKMKSQQNKSSPHGWNQQQNGGGDYFVGSNVSPQMGAQSPQMARMAQGGGQPPMGQPQQAPAGMMNVRMPPNASFNGQGPPNMMGPQQQFKQQQIRPNQQQAKLGMYGSNGPQQQQSQPVGSGISMSPGAMVSPNVGQQHPPMQAGNNYGYQMQRMSNHNQQQMAPNYPQQQQQQQMIRAQNMRGPVNQQAIRQQQQQQQGMMPVMSTQQQRMRGQTIQANNQMTNQMAYQTPAGQQNMTSMAQQQRFVVNGQQQQQQQQQYWSMAPQQQGMGMPMNPGDVQFQQQQAYHQQPQQQSINNFGPNSGGFYAN